MIKIGGLLLPDELLAGHTSFRIGGPADLYAAPATFEDAVHVIESCRREGIPCFFLGGGTNLLVADRGIRGVVLDTSRLCGSRVEHELLVTEAGAPISAVADEALRLGLTGLEFAASLPGSVGGAVWMNARCYEHEMADVLAFVDARDATGTVLRQDIDKQQWSYKHSPFQESRVLIVRAGFRLAAGDRVASEALMRDHRADRERKGHFLYPCAGSVFKNNRSFGAPTGKLIDSLGLKGTKIGGAQIASFHGNIIVNTGGATARDVRALIELVEAEVRVRLGFVLEREVILAGDWEGKDAQKVSEHG